MFSSQHKHKLLLKRTNSLIHTPVYKHYLSILSTHEEEEEEEEQVLFEEDINLKLPFSLNNHFRHSCNSCGGIVWFRDSFNKEIVVWNPTTSELTTLPPPPHSLFPVEFSGFGYDSISDDYKFIRIISPHLLVETLGRWTLAGHTSRAELFSFNTHSWKEISNLTVPYNYEQRLSAYVDGSYYWLATFDYDYYFIFSFHFATETFSTLPLPGSDDHHACSGRHVVNFDGSLGVFRYPEYDFYDATTLLCVHLWVFNLESSLWTKVFDVSLNGVSRPLGFGGNACRLLFCEGTSSTQLLVYDRITQELKELRNYDTNSYMEIISYVETTDPLPKAKH